MSDGSLDSQYGMKGIQNDEYSISRKLPGRLLQEDNPKGRDLGALIQTSPWMDANWKRQF